MPMLRHSKTGELYPYNASLARHPDIEVVEDKPVAVEVVKEVKVAEKAKRSKKAAEPEVQPEPAVGDADVDFSDLGDLDIE